MKVIAVNAKAFAALAGIIAYALLEQYGPGGTLGAVLTIVFIVAGAVGTWAVPNADARAWAE